MFKPAFVVLMALGIMLPCMMPCYVFGASTITNSSVVNSSSVANVSMGMPPALVTAYDPLSGTIWRSYILDRPYKSLELDWKSLGILAVSEIKSAMLISNGSGTPVLVVNGSASVDLDGPARLDVEIYPGQVTAAAYGIDTRALNSSYGIQINNGSISVRLKDGVEGVCYHFSLPIPEGYSVRSINKGEGGVISDFYTTGGMLYFYDDPSTEYLVLLEPIYDKPSELAGLGPDGWGPLNVTAQPWPENSSWIPVMDTSWQPIRAPTYDVSPKDVDISSGGNGSVRIGPNNSIFFYYDNLSSTVFFRMLLSDSPLQHDGGVNYDQYMWGVMIDINGDSYADWGIFIDGKTSPIEYIKTGYNLRGSQTNEINYFIYFQDANPSYGFTRVTADGMDAAGSRMYYLDLQAPLSAFSVSNPNATGNITENTPIRLFFGTSTSSNTINKDLLGLNSINFSLIQPLTANGTANGIFGMIYDTRDPSPPSNQGVWYYGQNVTANGWGWPINQPTVTNLSVRVADPNGTIVSTTAINYNLTTGAFTNMTLWSIPIDGNNAPGIYSIQVKNPIDPAASYRIYDYFTLMDNIPPVVRNVTIMPDPSSPGGMITISANVTDNYQVANVTASILNATIPMTYNSTLKLYTAVAYAPGIGGAYTVNVTAYDTYGNSGSGSGSFSVISSYPRVTKNISWDANSQRYKVSLIAYNPGNTATITIYDYVPAGYIFSVGGIDYPGPQGLQYSNMTPQSSGWQINYTIMGVGSAYSSTNLYHVGIDPFIVEACTS